MPLKNILLFHLFFITVPICFAQTVPHTTKDSATAVASTRYMKHYTLRRILMGENYRETWATPVKLPVFYLSGSEFQIERLGGSKQTKSLYLRDKEGKQWVLRSVDKDVKQGIPKLLQYTPFAWYKQDLISAAYPYAAVVVAELAKKLNITAPEPVVYFIADDKALGEHASLFANTVAMLEKVDLAPGSRQVIETDSVTSNVDGKKASYISQKEYLKTRILDMIVGDWDRHEGNWLWWISSTADTSYYHPIPRDRDHALFYTRGIIPGIMKVTFEPHLVGFRETSSALTRLNKKARSMDKKFLKDLPKQEWIALIGAVQKELTDDVIDIAVRKLPAEVWVKDGKLIKQKLISRRNTLMENVLDYHRFLF